GIEEALARIWAAAAREDVVAGLDSEAEALALGDPRLAGRLQPHGEVRVRTRTRVLTLVVVAERPETTERALDAINLLASRHPSRAIVLAPGDPDGPSTLDAQIFCHCTVVQGGAGETCTEQILVRCGGQLDQHLAELVTPLLIHDLPVVLWWADDPPFGRRPFSDLLELSNNLLVDSGRFRGDGADRLVGLAEVARNGEPLVRDIAWNRLTLWRELLAGLFDHPLLAPELASMHGLRIDVSKPGQTLRLSKAALFTGWLAARLGWSLESPLEPGPEGQLRAAYHRDGQRVRVEIQPLEGSTDRSLSPGSLARVELVLGRRGHDVRARVTRQADHLLATADWGGAQVARRAGRLEPFGEAPYVADALDGGAPDHVLVAAVEQATRLTAARGAA
ncbi:MAG TPA: glucose-6-phosphate dehydrogenase assembly protein OpcA, partial [Candidatus Limnocylindrales bacterium]|nr:glucose-6-phosphate dehydrogenase assembly protein OpcA [Candidatus Limnocylindrales bacterium]